MGLKGQRLCFTRNRQAGFWGFAYVSESLFRRIVDRVFVFRISTIKRLGLPIVGCCIFAKTDILLDLAAIEIGASVRGVELRGGGAVIDSSMVVATYVRTTSVDVSLFAVRCAYGFEVDDDRARVDRALFVPAGPIA